MKIIRYIDLVDTVEEDGELYETVIQSNFTVPVLIDSSRIDSVYPFFTSTGKLFKNVAVIKYEGEMLKVVGNYKDIHARKNKRTPIGFINGKQGQKEIENRTKIKSTIKPRTKGSSK